MGTRPQEVENSQRHRGDETQNQHQVQPQHCQDHPAGRPQWALGRRRNGEQDRQTRQTGRNTVAHAKHHAGLKGFPNPGQSRMPKHRMREQRHWRRSLRTCAPKSTAMLRHSCTFRDPYRRPRAISTPRSWIFLRRVLRLRPRISAARTWLPRVAASVSWISGRSISSRTRS